MVLLLGILVPYWFGRAEVVGPNFLSFSIEDMGGIRFFLSLVLKMALTSFWYNFGILFLAFFLRIFLRNQKVVVFMIILLAPLLLGSADRWSFAILMIIFALWLTVIMRFGIAAGVFMLFAAVLTRSFPRTPHSLSTWLSDYNYIALAIFSALVIYAFLTSLAGRPVIGERQFED
jgi:hypothetical protein